MSTQVALGEGAHIKTPPLISQMPGTHKHGKPPCFPFGGSPENVCEFKHEGSANLKLLVMEVVFLFIVNVASPNKGRRRSDWLV